MPKCPLHPFIADLSLLYGSHSTAQHCDTLHADFSQHVRLFHGISQAEAVYNQRVLLCCRIVDIHILQAAKSERARF